MYLWMLACDNNSNNNNDNFTNTNCHFHIVHTLMTIMKTISFLVVLLLSLSQPVAVAKFGPM